MACKLFDASSSSFVVTMKIGTRIRDLMPRPIQTLKALLLLMPGIKNMIFRRRLRASDLTTDPHAGNEVIIKRNRVIQFNAFLKIEKSKHTIIKPASGTQIIGQAPPQ
jgi:hypothetical protein